MALELFVPLSPPKGVRVFSEVVMNPGREHGRRGMSDILFFLELCFDFIIVTDKNATLSVQNGRITCSSISVSVEILP